MRKLTVAGLFMFTVSSSWAQEQTTAYEAMRLVGQQLNRAYLGRVISVTGVNGDPQPTKWTILLADRGAPGGIREVQVAKGRIVSNKTPSNAIVGSAENAMFPAAKLNLDSDGAFSVASYTANTSHVNFDSISYMLRTSERGAPFWIVTLQDNDRRPVGTIHINAIKGNIARVEGMFGGANMAQNEQRSAEQRGTSRSEPVEEAQSEDEYVEFNDNGEAIESEEDLEDDEDENVVKRQIKGMFRKTKNGVQRVFQRTRNSFQKFLDS